jgi:two-component system CheB/CheR fusion protein
MSGDGERNALRREAEERLRARGAESAALGAEDMKALVHELEVHQIELGIQNEELRHTEQALAEALEGFRDLYENAPIGYLTLDATGALTRANTAAAALCGDKPARLIGRRFESLLHRGARDNAYLLLREVAGSGLQKACELRLQRPDGTLRWVRAEAAPERQEQAAAAGGFRVTLADITERKESEEALRISEERFRVLVEGTARAVWETDPGGEVITDSPSWRVDTGFPPARSRGLGWLDAVHPDDRGEAAQRWREALHTARPLDLEVRLHQAAGGWRWTNLRAAPLRGPDGRVARWLGMSLDISERKRAEEAEASDRRKTDFLAMLGHELRNPLAAIVSGLEVLELTGLSPEASEVRGMMARQGMLLERLMNDLLDVSRITLGAIALQRVRLDLAAAVREVIAANRPQVQDRRVAVEAPAEPLTVDADPVRLSQILTNLLDNAVKFTRADDEIQIMLAREGNMALICVRDKGVGMDADMVDRVFDMFAQAQASGTPGQAGLGLGLALVRALVELHGGRVEASSEGLGRGSELRVRLPLAEAPPALERAAPPQPESLASRRVLVVDDNRDLAEGVRLLLGRHGAEVRVAYDGASALAICESWRPTHALMDLSMPGMDGYELARRLRECFREASLRLIAMSGWGQETHRARAQAAGFDVYLTKPVSLQGLLDALTG